MAKVKALKVGEYPSGVWRKPGEVFDVASDKKISKVWMAKVTAKEAKAAEAEAENEGDNEE